MKLISEFRQPELVAGLVSSINRHATKEARFMEFCGGHTHAIMKFGLRQLLPSTFTLTSGPSCPVCVSDNSELDKAIAEYERLITFDPRGEERLLIHPKYHYRVAKLYEEKGWPGRAIEEYEKFIEICKDADPGMPEVEDARKRLSDLKVP